MPDERMDSMRQGIGAPPESPEAAAAAEARSERAAQGPRIGGEMGGTSDTDRPGEEAQMNAARWAADHPEEAGDAGNEEDPAAMYRDIPEDRVGG